MEILLRCVFVLFLIGDCCWTHGQASNQRQDQSVRPDNQELIDNALGVAELAWTTSTALIENHVAPPLRNQMILNGARSFNAPLANQFHDQITKIQNKRDLQELIEDFSRSVGEPDSELIRPQVFANAMLKSVSGSPRLISNAKSNIEGQLAENRYIGIGIAIQQSSDNGVISITKAFRGGPAHLGGVISQDEIVGVNGTVVAGLPLSEVVGSLRGIQGSQVTISVRQPGKSVREIKMTRHVVPIASVEGVSESGLEDWDYAFEGHEKTAYLRFSNITGSTAAEVLSAARVITKKGFQGVILDFRGCRTGKIHDVRMVADTLISSDRFGSWVDKDGKVTHLRLRETHVLSDIPMALIVSKEQKNEVKLLIESLILHRQAIVTGALSSLPIFIFGDCKLSDEQGVLVGIPIGIGQIARKTEIQGESQPLRGHFDPSQSKLIDPWTQKALDSLQLGPPQIDHCRHSDPASATNANLARFLRQVSRQHVFRGEIQGDY